MNIHTFKDAVQSRRTALVHDLDNEDDDAEEPSHRAMTSAVEGEEDESADRVRISHILHEETFLLSPVLLMALRFLLCKILQFNDTGMVMEPFNLKNEREGGYFDENQNYVFKKEVAEVDAWVSALDEDAKESAIQAAAMAENKRLAKIAEQEADLENRRQRSTAELKQELLSLMQPGETVSGALRRLSGKSGTNCSCNSAMARIRLGLIRNVLSMFAVH